MEANTHTEFQSNRKQNHSLKRNLVILGLLALIFILPVSVIFLKQSTEDRPQASIGEVSVDIQTPYVNLSADKLTIKYQGQQVNIYPELGFTKVHPFMSEDQDRLRLTFEMQTVDAEPIPLDLVFSRTNQEWNLVESSIRYRLPNDEEPTSFFNDSNDLQGIVGTPTVRGAWDKTYTSDSLTTMAVHFTNLKVEPFLYTLQIPYTETGYFIENRPEENTVDGKATVWVAHPATEIAILRDAEGKIVKDQSNFEYEWTTPSDTIQLSYRATSTTECTDLGIQSPCPQVKIGYVGTIDETTTIHLRVSQNGETVAETDFPIQIGDGSTNLHPIDVSTPYVSLKADDFYIEYDGTQYFFDQSRLTYPVNSQVDTRGKTTLELQWINQERPLRLFIYFEKLNQTWYATEMMVNTSNEPGSTYLTENTDIQGAVGSTFQTSQYNTVIPHSENSSSSVTVHFSNLELRPFIYQLDIPDTESGYFLQKPPAGYIGGKPVIPVGTNFSEYVILRDETGKIVQDQSSFSYEWSVDHPNIVDIGDDFSYPCNIFEIESPCPEMSVTHHGVSPGDTIVRVNVKRDGSVVASAELPVTVYDPNTQPTPTPLTPITATTTPICPADTRSFNRKADFNDDDKINLKDYAILVRDFLKPNKPDADANCDGKVNLTDYNILVRDFLK